MPKINIYHFINGYLSIYDAYVNSETGEIIDEYDYVNLLKLEKDKYIAIPKEPYIDQEKIAKDYLKRLNNPEVEKALKEVYQKKFTFGYMDSFHCLAEDYGFWLDFMEYQHDKEKEVAINWCVKNKFDHYYEAPIGLNTDEEIRNFLDKNKKRYEYYANKIKNADK